MPLFIPVVIGVAALGTSLFGASKARRGIAGMQAAKRIASDAQERHRMSVNGLEAARLQLRGDVGRLDALRSQVAATTLPRIVGLLERLERSGRLRGFEPTAVGRAAHDACPAFGQMGVQPVALLNGAVTAGLTGAGAGAIATSLVSSFATASTGAAISGLSGAAAESALLAWLGGGSLAAGGWGMAAGAVVLNGIAVGPAIAIGGLVLAAQGEKAVTNAMRYSAEVDTAVERLNALVDFHARARQRVAEIAHVTVNLWARADAAVVAVEPLADSFDVTCDEHVTALATALMLCRALGEVARAQVIDATGNLDQRTGTLLEQLRGVAGLLS